MAFLATGRYRIERGETEGDFGDPADSAEAVAEHVLASVTETGRATLKPADGRVSVTRTATGRFRSTADVQPGDRIVNEADTTEKWTVLDVHQAPSVAKLGDLLAAMTRTTAGEPAA